MAGIPNVLSIAGSDPSGGAGVQGDLKTFAALRVYGCAVPTALTAQSTAGVSGVLAVPAAFVTRQLAALFADVEIHAVKIGMLGTASVVRAVAAALVRYRPPHVVLDPVLRASTGSALMTRAGVDALRAELLPLATVVTPNAAEAGALLDRAAPRTLDEVADAAAELVRRGARAALVTGGHLDTSASIDVLHDGDTLHEFHAVRVPGGGAHGTGCALAATLAALLARDFALPAACATAQRFVVAAIAARTTLRVGRGRAPVHVLGSLW